MNTKELKRLAEPLAAPNGSDSDASWWDSFHRAANPSAILALIQQRDELLAAWKEYQNSDFSVSCQRGVVGKCMCAKCTHNRASAAFSKADAQS